MISIHFLLASPFFERRCLARDGFLADVVAFFFTETVHPFHVAVQKQAVLYASIVIWLSGGCIPVCVVQWGMRREPAESCGRRTLGTKPKLARHETF